MYKLILKRLLDIILVLLLLSIFFPVIVILAFVVYMQDFSNPFFLQERVGKNLRFFRIIKLRTMKVGSHKHGYSTQASDSRITPFGAILRKTSLDELPQILNVLFGHMSLVGPRPDVPKQREQYASDDIWELRHTIRPGITGLAQATKRSLATPKERTDLDLKYVKTYTFLGDVKILLQTVLKVFNTRTSL